VRIYEKDTHQARCLYVENEEQFTSLEGKLIESIDHHNVFRPAGPVTEEGVFYFDITSCESFSAYLINRKLSRAEIISVLAQLKSVITTMENHMLGDANILLEPEHLYIDKSSRKIRFVPVCRQQADFTVRLRKLTEVLFLHADLEDTESLRFAAMMMRVSLKETVHLYDLMQLVEMRRLYAPEEKSREPVERKETDAFGREVERLHGSSVIGSPAKEELTMRISEEEWQEAKQSGMVEETTIKEETGGLRGVFRDIARGFRERMDEDED